MTNATPVSKALVDACMEDLHITNAGEATIRELVALVNAIEQKCSVKYVRMEMGVPGLPAAAVGVEAEIEALRNGVASAYPPIDGIAPLKQACASFAKNFIDIDINPQGCIPTVGAMQGTYAAFMVACGMDKKRDTILFIDPGFPVQKQQITVMGGKYQSFDLYDYRGAKLEKKLRSYLEQANISALVYANPNNPTWVCLTEEELAIIGKLANEYDVLIMEDLAYFAMDFRKDLHHPGQAPYQPTVAKYTDKYVLFISGSKIFSYAGQRIGMMLISDAVYNRTYPQLQERFLADTFGNTVVQRVLYSISSGTSHSAQWAMTAMLEAANNGSFNFVEELKAYGRKAEAMKKIFITHGFHLVYDKDGEQDVADGFYFTIGYKDMSGSELLKQLLYYGISGITLKNTGSSREGLRACVSHVQPSQFEALEQRLKQFNNDFS